MRLARPVIRILADDDDLDVPQIDGAQRCQRVFAVEGRPRSLLFLPPQTLESRGAGRSPLPLRALLPSPAGAPTRPVPRAASSSSHGCRVRSSRVAREQSSSHGSSESMREAAWSAMSRRMRFVSFREVGSYA